MRHAQRQPTIVLGITADHAIGLLRGFPQMLAEDGWSVHIFSNPGPGLKEFENIEGIQIHGIPMVRDPSPRKDLKTLVALINLLVKIKPDVVSVGTPKAGLLGTLAAFISRVPRRVYHLRGLRLETETGFRRKILLVLEKVAAAAATDVLAISPSLKQKAIEVGVVKSKKIFCLGRGSSNGVDLDVFHPGNMSHERSTELRACLGLSPKKPIIGFVGRLAYDKGIIELARASKLLHERGVDHQLLLVGRTEFRTSTDIWADAELSGDRKPVVTGAVRRVEQYYGLMDLFALPTHREGMGNVILEASACAVPVVSTLATGARDAVVNAVTGYSVPVGDPEALAEALAALLADTELRAAMSAAGVVFVRENFERQKVWQKLLTYYKDGAFAVKEPNTTNNS